MNEQDIEKLSLQVKKKEKLQKRIFSLFIRKPLSLYETCVLWFEAFIAISLLIFFTEYLKNYNIELLLASFGASTVILFALPKSPFSSFRSLVGGHAVCALVGVLCFQIPSTHIALICGLTVATALVAMLWTDTLHPPGGATALNFILGGSSVQDLGFGYIIFPCLIGSILLFIITRSVQHILKLWHPK